MHHVIYIFVLNNRNINLINNAIYNVLKIGHFAQDWLVIGDRVVKKFSKLFSLKSTIIYLHCTCIYNL